MTHTVVIGGGAVGFAAAEGLAEVARDGEQVSLVAEHADFRAGLATPWLSASETLHFDLAQALQRKGVALRAAGARRLHPDRNQLELGDGALLDYDVALITTGPRLAFEEVEGLGPQGHTQSLCRPEHVRGCARAWQFLLSDPGPVIVGAVKGASCLAPAYESALRIDSELRRHGVRDRAPITFVTPEPFLGDLGVGGIDDSRSRLEQEFASRDIAWIDRAVVDRVESDTMRVHRLDEHGTCIARYTLRFRYAMMMPAFRGIAAVAGIEGLADERGFLLVDEHLRNPRYRNIYAAGVAVASPTPRQAERQTPYMIEGMVETVLRNIRDQLDGREPAMRASWSIAHLADLGAGGLSFLADPHAALGPQHGVHSGGWAHLSRCALCDVGQNRPADSFAIDQ